MDPLSNQPNNLTVCEVRAVSIKSRLNIGPGGGAQGPQGWGRAGAVRAPILFFPWHPGLTTGP